jgi:hypothetical protein
MRRRAVFTLAVACLLGACLQPGSGVLPSLAWSLYDSEGEGRKLAYGAPSSDDVVLMLTCAPHSGEVIVSTTSAGDSERIMLASAGQKASFDGEAIPSAVGQGMFIEASAPADHPALARFARTGELWLKDAGRSARLPVRAAERGRIREFFDSCRAEA